MTVAELAGKGARGTGSVFVRSSAMPWMDSMSISLFFGEAVHLVELVCRKVEVFQRAKVLL